MRDEVLVSMCSTSLMRFVGFLLYLDVGVIQNAKGLIAGPEAGLKEFLGHLQNELRKGPGGGFFMGKEPGRADIMLEFPISSIKHRDWVGDFKKEFPDLNAWLMRVYDRPAWKRALEKGWDGVYDLSVFPKIKERM